MDPQEKTCHVDVFVRTIGPSGLNANTPPQAGESPRADAKCFAFVEGSAFVKISATMSSVGQ